MLITRSRIALAATQPNTCARPRSQRVRVPASASQARTEETKLEATQMAHAARIIDHYPRYAPPLVDRSHCWRDKGNPQAGDWEHVCTSGDCPIGAYYVTAIDAGSTYYMAGPYRTHVEALALVNTVRDIADKHDGRAWFMSWGTVRLQSAIRQGSMNRAGLI